MQETQAEKGCHNHMKSLQTADRWQPKLNSMDKREWENRTVKSKRVPRKISRSNSSQEQLAKQRKGNRKVVFKQRAEAKSGKNCHSFAKGHRESLTVAKMDARLLT